MSWRPVRFTWHYAIGLIGGIGFGLFVALSLLGEEFASGSLPRKVVGVAGLLVAMATQFLYVREMKQLHQAGSSRHAEPGAAADPARDIGSGSS